jgi:Ion transport protein
MLHRTTLEFPSGFGGSESLAESSGDDLRRRLAVIFEDEEPRSRMTRLFDTALALLMLRLLRLLRMLKLVRHSTTFTLLFAVPREERQSISALLFVLLLTVTIAGSLMFMIENDSQPEVFASIPIALFSGLITVGFLDQLRAYRELHGKPHVVIAGKPIAIVQKFTVAEGKDGDEPAQMQGVCPHCGAVLATAATTLGEDRESLRA